MMSKMTKCDFCTESDSKGNCFWTTRCGRRIHCEKAIEKMVKTFSEQKGANKT